MSNIVIGIDPDSKAHGVAIYEDGVLVRLECMELMKIIEITRPLMAGSDDVEFAIENVKGNNAVFRNSGKVKTQGALGRCLGMVQQSQTELERALDYLYAPYKLYKISRSWKKDKRFFEVATKWKGRSNEDTRSAAYFGFLHLKGDK